MDQLGIGIDEVPVQGADHGVQTDAVRADRSLDVPVKHLLLVSDAAEVPATQELVRVVLHGVLFADAVERIELILGDERLKSVWIDLLEGSLRYKIYRENGFLVENATERYLAFRKRFPELISRIPQRYIATYLGIKPESLSRIKSALKEEEEQ